MKEALGLTLGALLDIPFESRSPMQREAITAAREALAQPEQEVDWKDQYEKQKRRAEMWIAKYEEVAGPLPYAVPLAQPEQEPVAGDVHTEHCFQGEYKHCCKYGDGDDCTAKPKRPWVGLTDEEIEDCMEMSIQKTCRAIEAKLKELNT